jgi:calcineurin-like phosphoesterase family protein
MDSPLRALVHLLYHIFLTLRGKPFTPHRSKPAVKLVCISDTHTNILPVAHGDVLIHAGDLANKGNVEEIQKQLDWIASLPHKEKIVIAGNHDSYFDPKSRREEDKGKKLDFKGIHYLENKSITLKFKGGRKLNFYGSPDIPQCGGNDFA